MSWKITKSILVKNFDGRVEKAEVIPHDIPVDLAIITSGFSQIELRSCRTSSQNSITNTLCGGV